MPGTANPQTTVVRAGRGGAKYVAPDRFQAAKSRRIGQEALDAQHARSARHRRPRARRRCRRAPAWPARRSRRRSPRASPDRPPPGRTGAAGRRTARRRRSRASSPPMVDPRADHDRAEVVCSPVQPSRSDTPLTSVTQGPLDYPVRMPEHGCQARALAGASAKAQRDRCGRSCWQRPGLAAGNEGPVRAGADEGSRRRPLDGQRGANGLAMLGIVEIRHGQGVFVTGERRRPASRRPSPRRSSAASRTSSSRRA